PDPRPTGHPWQPVGVDPGEPCQRLRRQHLGRDVVDPPRQVAYGAVRIQDPGLLPARPAVAQKLHGVGSPRLPAAPPRKSRAAAQRAHYSVTEPPLSKRGLRTFRHAVADEGPPFRTRITCSRRGPWAPSWIVCSMSAVRDGPVIMLTVRGIAASPYAARSRSQASS